MTDAPASRVRPARRSPFDLSFNLDEATNLIVQGFLEVFTKELPMEYAIEFNRLVKLEMEGSLG